MKNYLSKSFIVILLISIFFYACDENDPEEQKISDDTVSYRISRILFEREAYSSLRQNNATIFYQDEKIDSIVYTADNYIKNFKFEYDLSTVYMSFYIDNEIESKQTFIYDNDNLILWMIEEDDNGDLDPVEKIVYNYNDGLLVKFLTYDYTGEWHSYIEGDFSYIDDQLETYSLYFNWNEGDPEEFKVESKYYYQGDILSFVERFDYEEDESDNEIYHYYFTYENDNLINIKNYCIENSGSDSTLYEQFEFTYNSDDLIYSISFEKFDNYGSYTKSEWTYEYEEGIGNLKFDKEKLIREFVDWHVIDFDENSIINNFYTILPE